MIEPPLWLVILPIAATPVVYLTRRWSAGTYVAALASLLAGFFAWSLPPTNMMRLMGRSFLLDPLTQQVLALLFVTSAVMFLASHRLGQGSYFAPLGLVVLALFAIAGMSRHLAITALAVTLAAVTCVPVIQGEQTGSTRAAWRFLVMMFIALPFFLLAAWRVDLYREDVEHAAYLGHAAIFLATGLSIWLAAVPMYGWLTAVGAEAPPLAAVFVLVGFPLVALVTLSHVLAEASWFAWTAEASRLLLLAGLASVALGGTLASVQRSLRSVMGYSALFGLGCLLVALAVRGSGGGLATYSGAAMWVLGLALVGIATAIIRHRVGDDAFAGLQGAAGRLPLAVTGLMLGGFTLAGLPLTAGFPARWVLLRDLAQVHPGWVWWVVASGVGVAIGYLRALKILLTTPAETTRLWRPNAAWLATALLVLLGLLTVGLGLFPDPLFRIAMRLVGLSLPGHSLDTP